MNDFLAFEVSSSNALNALVELADKNEYNINVQYTYNENDVLTKSFTFE